MNYEEIKGLLANRELVRPNAFELLKSISNLANRSSEQSEARECVIRALAVQEEFPADYQELLDSLVRAVGLMPYVDVRRAATLEDLVEIEAHRAPIPERNYLFHTLQLQIYKDLLAARNVVLSATTSVGKSLVVDAVIASGKHRVIAIIVPTIALIDETRRRLMKNFSATHDVITHPTQRPDFARPTIFVLTQERALGRDDLADVEFFVVDEFYKLDLRGGDTERAVDLNLCFHRLAKQGAQFYLIGPHISGVEGLAARYKHVFVPSEFSTVAVDVEHFALPREGDDRKKKLVELCKGFKNASLIYCQSPAKAAEVAEYLLAADFLPPIKAVEDAVDWLREEYPGEWIVIKALSAGVGIHHGNIPRAIQQYMIRAFQDGIIKYLVCTSTIIEGVNTIAENVVIYDKRVSRATVDYFTFKNIAGRAGRMNEYFIGKVYVLEAPPEEADFAVEMPIERQSEATPVSLLLDLPEEDLAPISKLRLQSIEEESPLSIETLRKNRHVSVESQNEIYYAISSDLLLQEDALSWSGMPKSHQLLRVCDIIFKYIDRGSTLGGYSVTSGVGLKAELDRIRTQTRFLAYIQNRLAFRRPDESISDSVERSLRFLRRYVSYTFPRQLMVVSNIQEEIYKRAGREKTGDYSFFAARAENLFMEPGLFALDEYGVPLEMARRLGGERGEFPTLESALRLLANLGSEEVSALHPFEREVISDVRSSMPRAVPPAG